MSSPSKADIAADTTLHLRKPLKINPFMTSDPTFPVPPREFCQTSARGSAKGSARQAHETRTLRLHAIGLNVRLGLVRWRATTVGIWNARGFVACLTPTRALKPSGHSREGSEHSQSLFRNSKQLGTLPKQGQTPCVKHTTRYFKSRCVGRGSVARENSRKVISWRPVTWWNPDPHSGRAGLP